MGNAVLEIPEKEQIWLEIADIRTELLKARNFQRGDVRIIITATEKQVMYVINKHSRHSKYNPLTGKGHIFLCKFERGHISNGDTHRWYVDRRDQIAPEVADIIDDSKFAEKRDIALAKYAKLEEERQAKEAAKIATKEEWKKIGQRIEEKSRQRHDAYIQKCHEEGLSTAFFPTLCRACKELSVFIPFISKMPEKE